MREKCTNCNAFCELQTDRRTDRRNNTNSQHSVINPTTTLVLMLIVVITMATMEWTAVGALKKGMYQL